jgi:hypothetical protein
MVQVGKVSLATSTPLSRFQRLLAQISVSRHVRDGRIYLLLDEAARLATLPDDADRVRELLGTAERDPWQICQTVGLLARYAGSLPETALRELVRACQEALEVVPPDDREELLDDVARDGHHSFNRVELELRLERAEAADAAPILAGALKRLPPSSRAVLDLDRLVETCIERMGPLPPTPWLDVLLQTVAVRDLQDDALRERLSAVYAASLTLPEVRPRHRDRLFYLSRYAQTPVTRARLLVRYDFARLAGLPQELVYPEAVLEQLVHFPQVVEALDEAEAEEVLAAVFRRLSRRPREEDYQLMARTLCDVQRPEPFVQAFDRHMRSVASRASRSLQAELWAILFSAWLSPRMAAYASILEPLMARFVGDFPRELRREVDRQLQRRSERGIDALGPLVDPPSVIPWRLGWPFGGRAQV